MSCPLLSSHTLAVLSLLPVASCRPSGLKVTPVTSSVCPCVATHVTCVMAITLAILGAEVVTPVKRHCIVIGRGGRVGVVYGGQGVCCVGQKGRGEGVGRRGAAEGAASGGGELGTSRGGWL